MAKKHWKLDDIPWERLDRSKIDPDLEKVIRAAALVEFNAADYVAYLKNVFQDDPEFMDAVEVWGSEEVQHGQALSRWASLVDPTFDFEARFAAFRAGYRLNVEADASIRGSCAGELVARCMVEVGTSSYYSALGDACEEPVLKAICQRIAADELRHYKLFYRHLKLYLERESLNRLSRVRLALSRILETEDDELAYAFYAANNTGEPYDREAWNRAYMMRAYSYYRETHIDLAVAMIFKACGLRPRTRLFDAIAQGTRWLMQWRQKKLARVAAAEMA